MHRRDCKVCFSHLIGQPVDLSARVAENDGLCDGEGVVEIAECVEFPFFFFDGDEILLEAFECKFITLDKDADWICHELGGHVQDIVWKSSGDDDDLCGGWKVAIDIVNLFSETTIE